MATTYTDNGGGAANGSDLEFTFTFPVIQTEDVKVALNNIVQATTKYAVNLSSNPTKITFNNTSIDSSLQETSGAPKSGVSVRVYRETTVGKTSGDDDPKAVFAAGSSIRAIDLNANQEQALYAIHELQDQPITDADLATGAVTSAKIADGAILNVDVNASAAIDGTKISPDFGSQNIATTGTINNLTTTELAILDDATVSTAELNLLDGVTTSTAELNLLDGVTSTTAELNILDGVTATTAEINKLDGVTATTAELNLTDGLTATTAELNKLDGVTASTTELNLLDGVTATTAELNLLDGVTATTTELNLIDGVTATTAELNYVDGVTSNIQTQLDNKQPLDAELTELATMANGTASALADLNTGEVQILDGATVSTTELNKLDGVTASTAELNILDGVTATATELNLNDGQTATPTELNILDGATVTTTEINKLDGFTGSAADLNEVVTGKNVVETITGSATDAQLPTAQAVNERVVELVTEVGGFVPIANETSFPATNPDINDGAGTIVSIKALSSNLTSSGSGVATIANGAGTGNTVTINGMSNSTTYAAGKGLILETTSTLHTYNFHRLVLDETGVASIQVAIDDWDERYYGPLGSAPSTRPSGASRVQGDLYFSTADNQMKVFNNAAGQWDDVATSASSNIVTLTPAFNNSETEFTCSTVPIDAQSLLLSINGVVQKPNSGTSTPSEGFVKLANGKIKLATAPASGADYFAIALGNVVSVGTPSPNTVGATELKTGEIANTHVSSSAAIAGSKLADDSISLAKLEHGTSSNNGKFLRANNGADPTFESVITDLVNDTSPQLGGQLDSNNFDIKLSDGEKLMLHHHGSLSTKTAATNAVQSGLTGYVVQNSTILDGGSQDIWLTTTGKKITFGTSDSTTHEVMRVQCSALGASQHGFVNLNYVTANAGQNASSSTKLATTSTGITVTGTVAATSYTGDGANLTGINTDLVGDTSPQLGGNLDGNGKNITLTSSAGSNSSTAVTDAAWSRLEFDADYSDSARGPNKILLTSFSNWKAGFGISSNSFDVYTGGILHFYGNTTTDDAANKETLAKFITDGAVELYHNGTKKLETHSSGVLVSGNVYANDNNKFIAGTSNDLQIYHDGTDDVIHSTGTSLRTRSNIFRANNAANNAVMFRATAGGNFEAYHDGGLRFQTSSEGIDAGSIQFTGSRNSHIEHEIAKFASSGTQGANYLDNHAVTIGQTNGNWVDGNTGDTDTSFGLMWHYANSATGTRALRAGIHYDHKSTEQFKIWSSYGAIAFYTDTANSGNDTAEQCNVKCAEFDGNGHFVPGTNNARDLGSTSLRWRNIYTNDLHLSNEGSSNDVDQTWGNWTIQEGESDLFLKNNRSGKKYKFNLTEVS